MKVFLLRVLALFGYGAFSAYAMAPYNQFWIFFISLPALYYFTSRAEKPFITFLYGYSFGFGYFLFGLSWIANALLVDGNPYSWAWPLAVCGLPLILAVFYGFACLVPKLLSNTQELSGFIFFIAFFAMTEWLRGHLFTGFPWNLFAYSLANIKPLLQIAALGDSYWLNLIALFWFLCPALFFIDNTKKRYRLIAGTLIILSALSSYGFGISRIHNTPETFRENTYVKIVQPNIPQHEKWDRHKMTENFFKLVRLSYPDPNSPLTDKDTVYIIWPETATSHHYIKDQTSLNLIKQALQTYSGNAYLVTGYYDYNREKKQSFNSVIILNKDGVTEEQYNKHHLVPFGEYIPFKQFIPMSTVTNFSGFQKGSGPKALHTGKKNALLPLVCYEAIFPAHSTLAGSEDIKMIINVTNDAWYGNSAGPYQHFTHAIFRAVETGTPVIRVANTGISALIDQTGRIMMHAPLNTTVLRTLKIPEKQQQSLNFTYNNNIVFILMVMFLLLISQSKIRFTIPFS